MDENDTKRNWPREYQCSGCGTWGFEIRCRSNDPPRCSECGEQTTDMDDLDLRPSRLQDRIEEVILNIKTIEEDGGDGDEDAHDDNSDEGYGRKSTPIEARETVEYMDDDYTFD